MLRYWLKSDLEFENPQFQIGQVSMVFQDEWFLQNRVKYFSQFFSKGRDVERLMILRILTKVADGIVIFGMWIQNNVLALVQN